MMKYLALILAILIPSLALADDTATLQAQINAAATSGTCTVQLAAGTFHVSTLYVPSCVNLVGQGANPGASGAGTLIAGTTGDDAIVLTGVAMGQTSGGGHNIIEHLNITGARNGIVLGAYSVVTGAPGYLTYSQLEDLNIWNNQVGDVEIQTAVEETTLDRITTGQSPDGIYMGSGGNARAQGTYFTHIRCNGNTNHCLDFEPTGSANNYLNHFTDVEASQTGNGAFYFGGVLSRWSMDGMSTEASCSKGATNCADMTFAPTGGCGGILIANSNLGSGASPTYSIAKPCGVTQIMNTDLGKPIDDYPWNNATAIGTQTLPKVYN